MNIQARSTMKLVYSAALAVLVATGAQAQVNIGRQAREAKRPERHATRRLVGHDPAGGRAPAQRVVDQTRDRGAVAALRRHRVLPDDGGVWTGGVEARAGSGAARTRNAGRAIRARLAGASRKQLHQPGI